MNYYVVEGTPDGEYNATNKAREDVERILDENNISRLTVNTKYGVQRKKYLKWKQFLTYKFNIFDWNKSLDKIKEGDVVFIQYPLLNTTTNLYKRLIKYKEKGIRFVAIIHDLDSLRFDEKSKKSFRYKRVCKEDSQLLNSMNYVIAHNTSMKKELVKKGIKEENIIVLQLFDYLINDKISEFIDSNHNQKYEKTVIIAGNLSPYKAKYLKDINRVNVKFNLYGAGFEDSMRGNNIEYFGKFKPDELIKHLDGNFGLIWDGETIDTCSGSFGNYLRYNNPHKASLYLTAGIPIIVWKESALKEFVENNNVGISVDSLYDIKKVLDSISNEQYEEMKENALKISKKTRQGFYLQKAIDNIIG